MIIIKETLKFLYIIYQLGVTFLSIIHINNVTSKADQGMQLLVMQTCFDNWSGWNKFRE
jgi:hypothetical protein